MSAADDWGRPPRRMSTGTKVLLICLAVGGVCLLLCCGGAFYLVRTRMDIRPNNPVAARATAAEIADFHPPPGFEPRGSIAMNLPFVPGMKAAIYELENGEGVLIIAELATSDAGGDAQREMHRVLQEQNRAPRRLQTIRSESRVFEIGGREVRFLFSEAQDENGREYRVVSGSFPGKGGTAQLILNVEADRYEEEAVIKMIESLD
jgi:hypothetical protein